MRGDYEICWICFEIAALAFIVSFAMKYSEKEGYIQALSDIKDGRPQRYVMEKQKNGETKWVEK
jgi:hypothetical protein